MATQAISIERRQHSREGILGQLENITYGVLRKYGITGEFGRETEISGAPRYATPSRVDRVDRAALSCDSASLQAALPIVRRTWAKSWLRKEGTTMTANLFIVVNNPQPNRERRYPGTWLLYSRERDPLEVHVAHDSLDRPHVLDKSAA